MNLITDFVSLFFPEVCFVCGKSLFSNEAIICSKCYLHLPETNFHGEADNPVHRVFWGRVQIESATALYYYKKGGAVQKLIHQLKYKGHQEVGIYFGKVMGSVLLNVDPFKNVDTVVPIPLHRNKLKKRGYNQAELIAKGITEVMGNLLDTQSVYREFSSSTQTKKSRFKRWENVSEIFKLTNNHLLDNKHVLLVDDVITTGATMEACLQTLGSVEGIQLSVVALAFAHQ